MEPDRSVDDPVKVMCTSGIAESQVSRLFEETDDQLQALLPRPIEGAWPYPWIDVTYVKIRRAARIVSVAAIVAVGGQRRRPARDAGHGRGSNKEEDHLNGSNAVPPSNREVLQRLARAQHCRQPLWFEPTTSPCRA